MNATDQAQALDDIALAFRQTANSVAGFISPEADAILRGTQDQAEQNIPQTPTNNNPFASDENVTATATGTESSQNASEAASSMARDMGAEQKQEQALEQQQSVTENHINSQFVAAYRKFAQAMGIPEQQAERDLEIRQQQLGGDLSAIQQETSKLQSQAQAMNVAREMNAHTQEKVMAKEGAPPKGMEAALLAAKGAVADLINAGFHKDIILKDESLVSLGNVEQTAVSHANRQESGRSANHGASPGLYS